MEENYDSVWHLPMVLAIDLLAEAFIPPSTLVQDSLESFQACYLVN